MENESQPETQSNAPPESITTVCLNCGKVFEGNYCPQCGQSAQTGCFTFKFLIENLIAAFVGKDGGFWFTFKNLFTRPGGMIVEILNGKRKRYFSPFPLLFFTLTLYILVFTFTGSRTTYYLDEKEEEEIMAELEEAPDKSSEVGRSLYPFLFKCLRFYNNHYTACYMLTLPLMVIAARQAFGKQNKKRYNRTEYTIALVYSMVMVVLFRCVVSAIYLFSPQLSGQIGRYSIVIFFLSIVACFKTMMGYTLMKTAWRSLLTVILYYLLLGALLLVAVVVISVVLAL